MSRTGTGQISPYAATADPSPRGLRRVASGRGVGEGQVSKTHRTGARPTDRGQDNAVNGRAPPPAAERIGLASGGTMRARWRADLVGTVVRISRADLLRHSLRRVKLGKRCGRGEIRKRLL